MAKVLVTDDAAFMRMAVQQALEAHGHTMVGEAGDGVEAIERFAELKPDVVILDISMPQMNGLETVKRLKILEPEVKVIICSAIGYQSMLAEAIELGASEFIVKPFEPAQLAGAIDKVLA